MEHLNACVDGRPLVFVDLETTGGRHSLSRILEVGAVRVEGGRVVATYNQMLDPGQSVPEMITRITGIRTEDTWEQPTFRGIADDLAEILDGAVFVAHNVHFDYGFLKAEFERIGAEFKPKLLCTVKLSRKLYAEHRAHSLEAVIERHGLRPERRHRAFDDARAIWELWQIMHREHEAAAIGEAVRAQLRRQMVPSGLDPKELDAMGNGPGVYIFEGAEGAPLYVGKSIHLRTRVMSHFADTHNRGVEMRISQQISRVRTIRTHGELGALLTESRLVKELSPLYNRKLRRTRRIVVVSAAPDEAGYWRLSLDDVASIDSAGASAILATYPTMTKARASILALAKQFYLCQKLCGLEKASGACFGAQLGKCLGACRGDESPAAYNGRLSEAFSRVRIASWPFEGPVVIRETSGELPGAELFLVDNWCLSARVRLDESGAAETSEYFGGFDLDSYSILRCYLEDPRNSQKIMPLEGQDLAAAIQLGLSLSVPAGGVGN